MCRKPEQSRSILEFASGVKIDVKIPALRFETICELPLENDGRNVTISIKVCVSLGTSQKRRKIGTGRTVWEIFITFPENRQ
jgi:hypothetical protein